MVKLLVNGMLCLGLVTALGCGSRNYSTSSTTSAIPTGIKLTITKVDLGTDYKPVVTFLIQNQDGTNLLTSDVDANSFRFAIAKIVVDKGFISYENFMTKDRPGTEYDFGGTKHQPAMANAKVATADSTGVVSAAPAADGTYTYTWSMALPEIGNVPKTTTLVVGGQTKLTLADKSVLGANSVFSFVQDPSTKPIVNETVKTENCNGCHNPPISAHGGARVEVQYCVLCHTTQSTEPNSGNTVDFNVMIHKIHMGKNLPSVKAGKPYFFGDEKHNFSNTDFAAKAGKSIALSCGERCHKGGNGAWQTKANSASCGACHDDVNFVTGKNHGGGPQKDDSMCVACHINNAAIKGMSPHFK